MSELSHRYAEGTAQAWDRLMEQEDRDTERAEARAYPNHPYTKVDWAGLDVCYCGQPEHALIHYPPEEKKS
jgi:hypothetical protein